MQSIAKFFLVLIAGMFMLGLVGCPDQGPAERAGEEVDETVDDAGDAMEDAGDEMEDAVE